MSVKIKILLGVIISSMILSSSFIALPQFSPEKRTLAHHPNKENRPAGRDYPYGGTLVWGVAHPPTLINPILTQTSVSAPLMELIFDSLVRIDDKGGILPGLARAWDISPDGKQYIFYLNKGVLFHDGRELTAVDVKFTYEQINHPGNESPWRFDGGLVESWDIVDRYTIKVILKRPDAFMLHRMRREIVPKHLLEGKDLKTASFNYAPVGSGPFKLKTWNKRASEIDLEANPHYFEGRPYLDQVIVRIYSNNSSLWAALMRHEIDLVYYMTQEDYEVIKGDNSFKVYKFGGEVYSAIAYNLEDPILSDLEVRKAIAKSIDKKEMMAELGITGIESSGPFHPESMGFNAGVEVLEYDPLSARMDLMHRGWNDSDGDGVLEKYGQPLAIRLLVDERNDVYKKMAKMIRQQLSEVGIDINVLMYKNENDLTRSYLEQYRPQAWLRFFAGPKDTELETMRDWHSESKELGRLWKYENKEFDRLFELTKSAKDNNSRREIFQKVYEIIYEDQPACFLFFPMSLFAINSRFHNTEQFFTMYMPVYTIKNWYVE